MLAQLVPIVKKEQRAVTTLLILLGLLQGYSNKSDTLNNIVTTLFQLRGNSLFQICCNDLEQAVRTQLVNGL